MRETRRTSRRPEITQFTEASEPLDSGPKRGRGGLTFALFGFGSSDGWGLGIGRRRWWEGGGSGRCYGGGR